MALLLGIDLGTSYFKAGLFDEAGALRGLGRVAVERNLSVSGRDLLPVELFWVRLRRALDEALAQAEASAANISALSYSSQANTFVLLDGTASPLTPLIFWPDRRADPLEPRLAEFGESPVFAQTVGTTGIAVECAPCKWRWFSRYEPTTWKRAAQAMTISDYLTFALTGERVGDASTAALTALYSLIDREWWPEALCVFGLDEHLLSRPLLPGSLVGNTIAAAADLLGLPLGIPFSAGALDHHAAAIGAGLGRLADLSLSTGTVLAALVLRDEIVPSRGCLHGPHDGRYYRLWYDGAGAGQLEDYQKRRAPDYSVAELIAAAAESSAGVSPHDAVAHGVAVRALLEKITSRQRNLVNLAAGQPVGRVVSTGGGARARFWRQLQADMLNVPIVTPVCTESACLGAAMLAAVASGAHDSLTDASRAMVHAREVIDPEPAAVSRYQHLG